MGETSIALSGKVSEWAESASGLSVLKQPFLCYLIHCFVVTVWIMDALEKGFSRLSQASTPDLELHQLQ